MKSYYFPVSPFQYLSQSSKLSFALDSVHRNSGEGWSSIWDPWRLNAGDFFAFSLGTLSHWLKYHCFQCLVYLVKYSRQLWEKTSEVDLLLLGRLNKAQDILWPSGKIVIDGRDCTTINHLKRSVSRIRRKVAQQVGNIISLHMPLRVENGPF